jgi:hypothetical protein
MYTIGANDPKKPPIYGVIFELKKGGMCNDPTIEEEIKSILES